ncbi:MAG TPA: HNH endonuclease signature motif containing protein [Acidisarcina sp.]|nr:HNH endonuclease signature motif containing protein [Acidisarcina sp.]
MAGIQRQDARKILKIIASSQAKNELLTYSGLAVTMGRPADNSRAMASTCNLLDAAACLADVPLVAIVAVRSQTGEVNPAAFAREFDEAQRQNIIQRSQNHKFTAADFQAIATGLEDLGDKGAVRAWQFVENLYPGNLLYLRLIGDYAESKSNAIDDLGSVTPDRSISEVWTYSRDPGVREAVLLRANGRCEFCGKLGFVKPDGTRYLESHHVIALANEGEDRVTNVMALCPNDHREAHFGERRDEIEAQMVLMLNTLNP